MMAREMGRRGDSQAAEGEAEDEEERRARSHVCEVWFVVQETARAMGGTPRAIDPRNLVMSPMFPNC